jgi:hypothetical protein
MAVLSSAWPRVELNQQTLSTYYVLLNDLPLALLRAATLHLASEATFFPAAAEIRKAAFGLKERESGVPDGYSAFGEVMRAVGTVGFHGTPAWSHPLIGEALEAIGGWRLFCTAPESSIPSSRMRFVAAFDTLLARARSDVRMLPQVRELVLGLTGGTTPVLEPGSPIEQTASDKMARAMSRLAQEKTTT